MMDEEKRNQLRERRVHAALTRKDAQARVSHGAKLATAVAAATGKSMSLEDFDPSKREPPIAWPRDIKSAPGLVAAYISIAEARDLLACIRTRIRTLSGQIGFQSTPYLGLASVSDVDPMHLLALAEATEESVLFHSISPFGVVMVDCYYSYGEPFSIVVQGDELVRHLADCFPNQSP